MKRKLTDEIIINTVRENDGKTQVELAALMNCAQTTVSNNIRKLVDSGKIVQLVNTNGVYYYTLPERTKPVIAPPVVERVVIDTHQSFMADLKAEFKASLDKRVRAYLNDQYKKIMADLVQDLGL